MIEVIKVGIADDQQLFRKGIISLVNSFDRIQISMEATNGRELLDALANTDDLPDVLIVDLKMPELDGIEVTKLVREKFPNVGILILTSYNESRFILHLLDCGAHGYLFKDIEPDELHKAIQAVANKGYYFSPEILEIILNKKLNPNNAVQLNDPLVELSDREIDVLTLICKEYNASQIGELLHISPRTVEGHRNRLLEKTGCKNIAGLVVYALHNDIVELL